MINFLKGAAKSKTVWFGSIVAVLPWVQDLLTSNPNLLGQNHELVTSVIGVAVIALRALTTKSLGDKK